MLVFQLLNCLHKARKLTECDWDALQSLLPALHTLHATLHMEESLTAFVKDLETQIHSRGSPYGDSKLDKSKTLLDRVQNPLVRNTNESGLNDWSDKKLTRNHQRKRSNAEVTVKNLPDGQDDDSDDAETVCVTEPSNYPKCGSVYNPMAVAEEPISNVPINTSACNNLPATQISTYQQAMEEVCSPILPERGHGLLSIRQLLDARDPDTMKNRAKLLPLFQYHLKDEDSYIYLMSVQGLAALCEAYPGETIKSICRELNDHRTSFDRAKISEALTRSVRRLGVTTSKYKAILMDALLKGVDDPDCLVRAACLSTLGEVCKELKHSVTPELQTILTTAFHVLTTDESEEPRRAAVVLVSLLLRGFGADAIEVMQGQLKYIYTGLKELLSDRDEIVRIQAGVALEDVDKLTKDYLINIGADPIEISDHTEMKGIDLS